MKPIRTLLSLMLLCVLILTACSPAATAAVTTPTSNPQSIANTMVAATVASLSTEVASLKATNAAPTQTPESTAAPEGTPKVAATVSQATASARTASLCDFAAFAGDISIPDGTMIPPGTTFTKTWAIKNTGSCTWTPLYRLVYVGGDLLSERSVAMTETNVAPGETAHVSVQITAPKDNTVHRVYYKFMNADGGIFGVTDTTGKEQPVWTEFHSGKQYYFYDNMCLATWKTGSGRMLSCPGSPDDTDGSVYLLTNSMLQGGSSENEPVIVMQPPAGEQTTVVGQFPPVLVPEWAHLVTRIGCLNDLPNCSAHVKVTYSVEGQPEQTLVEKDVATTDKTVKIDIMLGNLFKKSTSFIFYVTANGEGADNKVFFLKPLLSP